jgi:hypothetical protein
MAKGPVIAVEAHVTVPVDSEDSKLEGVNTAPKINVAWAQRYPASARYIYDQCGATPLWLRSSDQ